MPRLVGGVLLAWCVTAAAAGLQDARALPDDPMARLDAEFLPFASLLPPDTATIGYLEQHDGAGSDDVVRTYYAAQYALAPIVVEPRVGAAFVIVARGTARPDGDERLEPYQVVAALPTGHRLFRRTEHP